ncbi:hypothetical protein E2C01_051252 [Portunus trituberculatus]|uniref:Uncharacterized protein n=1 Tax=Portunus trituberculatus TaxID=210409 RepID=A0A5B7GI60_PORTR|nr:hypothetical protein [Portunus trituberculatus]
MDQTGDKGGIGTTNTSRASTPMNVVSNFLHFGILVDPKEALGHVAHELVQVRCGDTHHRVRLHTKINIKFKTRKGTKKSSSSS